MTSSKQVVANRANALKSTGPQTAEGRAIVSANAVQHGVLSERLIVRDETLEELDAFRLVLWDALTPEGAIEELLAAKIIIFAWRLRRVIWAENEMFNGRGLYGTLKSPTDCVDKREGVRTQNLSRYESTLEKHFYRALHALQGLQAARQKANSERSWGLDMFGPDTD